jgi:CYTH domain-containing protein
MLEIRRPDFLNLLYREPGIAAQLARSLARRCEDGQRRIAEWVGLSSRLGHELRRLHNLLDSIQRLTRKNASENVLAIQLRYLVEVDESQLSGLDCQEIRQAYIALDENDEIRVRDDGQRVTITGKRDYGERRTEIQLELPPSLFAALFKRAGNRVIVKRRYLLDCQGKRWRVDVFDRPIISAGLAIAEVEIEEGEEIPRLPSYLTEVRDISTDRRYRNRCLAEEGPPS